MIISLISFRILESLCGSTCQIIHAVKCISGGEFINSSNDLFFKAFVEEFKNTMTEAERRHFYVENCSSL